MSYAFCAKAAIPLMRRAKGGAIVNVASVRSVVAGGGNLQYDTTKAAIAGLKRTSTEGAPLSANDPKRTLADQVPRVASNERCNY